MKAINIIKKVITISSISVLFVSCANFSHNPGASRGLASAAEKQKEENQKLRGNFYKGLNFTEVNQAVFRSVKKNY